MWMKISVSVLLLALLLVNIVFSVDADAMALHDASFERAMVAFGLAKALNAVISLLQGTQLSFTPVGVGLTFSIGEVLDPLNDLVEQFSWVMLFASVSLGVQKLLLVLSAKMFLQVALSVSIAVAFVALWYKRVQTSSYFVFSMKLLFFLLLLRFGAVLFVYSSQALYINVLESDFKTSSQVIQETTLRLEELQQLSKEILQERKEEGFFDRMSSKFDHLKESLNLSKQLQGLQNTLESASLKIINLITVFIVLSVVMPLLFLWLFVVSLKLIFNFSIKKETLYEIFKQEKKEYNPAN